MKTLCFYLCPVSPGHRGTKGSCLFSCILSSEILHSLSSLGCQPRKKCNKTMIKIICIPLGSTVQLGNHQGGGGTHADVNTLIKFAKCKLLHLLAACFVHTVCDLLHCFD